MLSHNIRNVLRVFTLMERKEKRQVSVLLGVSIINGLIQTLGVVSIMPFIALIAEPQLAQSQVGLIWLQERLSIETYQSLLLTCAALSFLAISVSNGFIILNYALSLKFFNARGHKLSSTLLRHFLKKSPLSFYKHSTSELSKIIFSDIDRVIIGSQIAAISIITDLIIFSVILTLLLYVNPIATILTVLALVTAYVLVYQVLSNKVKRLGQDFDQLENQVFSSLRQALNLYKEIRVFGKNRYFIDRFEKPTKDLYSNATRYHVLQFIPIQIIEVLVFSIILLLAVFLALNSVSAGHTITSIAVYAFAAYRIVPVLKSLFESTEEILYASPVLKGLLDELEEASSISNQVNEKQLTFNKTLVAENIHYRYPKNSEDILDNVSFTIHKGEMICLKGPSGIGKSTCLDLLLGLLKPCSGNIKVDGEKLTIENLSNWQSKLGYVPQQIQILDDSIARNIAFGRADNEINQKQVRYAAKLACIDHLIETRLSNGYDTIIGEGHQTLSGGEKQRVALARALYNEPECLILDEASNELDEATELNLLKNLRMLKTTVVFVSHKPSVANYCDRVIQFSQPSLLKAG